MARRLWNEFAALNIRSIHFAVEMAPDLFWRLARLCVHDSSRSSTVISSARTGSRNRWPRCSRARADHHDQCNACCDTRAARRWRSTFTIAGRPICAVSASTQHFLLVRERVPAERIALIYNGVDLSHFRPPVELRAQRIMVPGLVDYRGRKISGSFSKRHSRSAASFPKRVSRSRAPVPKQRYCRANR